MNTKRMRLSPAAKQDLDQIFDWIAADADVERAEVVLQRIWHTLELLDIAPRIGRQRTNFAGSPRIFTLWPWIIFYRPDMKATIQILRVLDGRRDLSIDIIA